MMASELAEEISEVPQLYEQGAKSTARLLRDSGFPEKRDALHVEEVEAALRRRPRLAELWLAHRGAQRLAGGWGLEHEDGHWLIQNYSDHRQLVVQDRIRACAEFVVRYVDVIAEVQVRSRASRH